MASPRCTRLVPYTTWISTTCRALPPCKSQSPSTPHFRGHGFRRLRRIHLSTSLLSPLSHSLLSQQPLIAQLKRPRASLALGARHRLTTTTKTWTLFRGCIDQGHLVKTANSHHPLGEERNGQLLRTLSTWSRVLLDLLRKALQIYSERTSEGKPPGLLVSRRGDASSTSVIARMNRLL